MVRPFDLSPCLGRLGRSEAEVENLVLQLDTTCAGLQFDRVAAVWIGGLEVLRTSTQEPNHQGIYYRVRKPLSQYKPHLLETASSLKIVMALDNLVNDKYTGVFNVTLTMHMSFNSSSTTSSSDHPDKIIPIS
jgi:hypothetical protein